MAGSPAPAVSTSPPSWPRAADMTVAQHLADALHAPLTPAIAAIGGNSPYLADLALAEPETFIQSCTDPEPALAAALHALAALGPDLSHAALAAALRQAKRRVALAVAMGDIGHAWPLERVTGALSDLADGALHVATAWLLADAARAGRLPSQAQDPAQAGFAVLAMGKLGARELNYSSDIDLILLHDPARHDPERHPYSTGSPGAIFTRLAHALVALLSARDAGGYVFRVDLRLRPDPSATPPSVSLPAALAHYESSALTWERAAMIKARAAAGDIAMGEAFLDQLRPFVWRRHLDFAAIEDIRALKRRMDAGRPAPLSDSGPPLSRLLGHDVKLGQGGIREIEFCAQTLQMVWGGRDPSLRPRGTLPALNALAAAGRMPEATASALGDAYRFLRRVEHRLQMVADRQTHVLPADPAGFAAFAAFFDLSPDALAESLLAHASAVHAAFSGLFANLPRPPDSDPSPEPALPAPAALAAMGFADPEPVLAVLATWQAGGPRAMRSDRARRLAAALAPLLLGELGRQPDPDTAFARFALLIDSLPAGVQVLAMLQHNRAAVGRLADVLGASASLADYLTATPSALEALLLPWGAVREHAGARRGRLTLALRDAIALDDALAIAARFVRAEMFRIAVAELERQLDTDAAGRARTAIADATLAAILPRVLADHERRHGRVEGGGLVILGLGKAGSRTLMAGSDLDLMLVYDHPESAADSSGPRRLPPSLYYARLAQGIVSALTVPTRDGPLFTIDMRLRPSGRAGPVAVSLAAFRRYHESDAWTWERMALTRARVMAGPRPLRARVRTAVREAMAQAGPPNRILADAASMRERMARDLPPAGPWDVRLRPGGLIEVEFIAQALVLATRPAGAGTDTVSMLQALARASVLPAPRAARLIAADRLWRRIQGTLRLVSGRAVPRVVPPALLARLGLDSEAALEPWAASVREAFEMIVQRPSLHLQGGMDEPG